MQKKSAWALSTRVWLLVLLLFLLCFGTLVTGAVLMARDGFPWYHPPVLALALLIALLLVLAYYVDRMVTRPYRRVQSVLDRFLAGQTVEELFALPYPLTPEMPQVLAKLSAMLNRQALLKDAMKQAEYLALQNQINPHFLYNTLEAIRGDAMLSGMGTIGDVAEALATYFRYTISQTSRLVTLGDELHNVESYFAIQQYRYGERLQLSLEYEPEDEALLRSRLPRLTLQPIVENAIIHGLEPKVGAGHIRIRFEGTQSRLLAVVSDDGVGVSPEALESLRNRLAQATPDFMPETGQRGGGIALVNVNSRIRLLFGEQYGLYLTSTQGVGTDVHITLPLSYGEGEEAL